MFTIQKIVFLLSVYNVHFITKIRKKKIKPEQQNQKNNQHTIAQDFLRKRIP